MFDNLMCEKEKGLRQIFESDATVNVTGSILTCISIIIQYNILLERTVTVSEHSASQTNTLVK